MASIVSTDLVRRLGLPTRTEKLDLSDEGGNPVSHGIRVQLPEVRLGSARFWDAPAVVLDLPFVGAVEDAPLAGILGSMFFRGVTLVLDYPARRLEMKQEALPPLDLKETFPFRYSHLSGAPEVDIEVGGRSLGVGVDTGSGYFMSLDAWCSGTWVPSGLQWVLNGTSQSKMGRALSDVRLGRYRVSMPIIDQSLRAPSLGGGFLKHFRLSLDQGSRLVRFERSDDGPIEGPSGWSTGFGVWRKSSRPEVAYTLDGTPASQLLKVGDVVLERDGKPVSFSCEERAKLGQGSARLKVERDGQVLGLEVPFVELLPP